MKILLLALSCKSSYFLFRQGELESNLGLCFSRQPQKLGLVGIMIKPFSINATGGPASCEPHDMIRVHIRLRSLYRYRRVALPAILPATPTMQRLPPTKFWWTPADGQTGLLYRGGILSLLQNVTGPRIDTRQLHVKLYMIMEEQRDSRRHDYFKYLSSYSVKNRLDGSKAAGLCIKDEIDTLYSKNGLF